MSPLWLCGPRPEHVYRVPQQGVLDWVRQLPPGAKIPTWAPVWYYSRGQSYISGYDYDDADRVQEIFIGTEATADLPFDVVVSASTDP